MKLWIDDIRPAPEGYTWIKSVDLAKLIILQNGKVTRNHTIYYIDLIDLDHDAGIYAENGGDYIKLLDWMEEQGINDIPIHIHSTNPVDAANMRRIIRRNNWEEV